MRLAPLLAAPVAVQVHAAAAIAAFCVGLAQLAGRKGSPMHRALGWTWVGLMAVAAGSAFWIHEIRLWGPWSPIHLLAVYTLVALPAAVLAARQHRVAAHRMAMISIFIGALVIAGTLSFLPNRVMHTVVFGR